MDYEKSPPYNPGNYPQNQFQEQPYRLQGQSFQPQNQPQYYPSLPNQVNLTMTPPVGNTTIVTQGTVSTGTSLARCQRIYAIYIPVFLFIIAAIMVMVFIFIIMTRSM